MRTILLFCLLLLSVSISAQVPSSEKPSSKALLKGKVVDDIGEPVAFASVALYEMPDSILVEGTATDINGNFSFKMGPGSYGLQITFLSYEEKWISDIRMERQDLNLGEILLRSNAMMLEEVEVVADKSSMEMKLDKRVFNVGKDLSNSGANASDILENIPSVAVDIDGNVSLRGSEGVRILINGKPSGLIGTDPGNALRQLQGNLIERIEVITNPSARYEAQGEVGIINIVLKKEQNQGLNGSFDVGVGAPHNHNAAYNLNFRKSWINFFSSYSVQYRKRPGRGSSYQEFNSPDTSFVFKSDRDHTREDFGNTARFGADLFLNDMNTLTVSGLYSWSQGDNISNIRYRDFNQIGDLTREVLRTNDELETDENIEFSVNHTMDFKEEDHKWTTQFQWVRADDTENADIVEEALFGEDLLVEQRSSNTEDEENLLFQSDYVKPFGDGGQFEAGVRAALRTVENDFLVEQLNDENTWDIIPQFNDDFTYQENIYAAYVMVGKEFENLSLQAGLRAEYSDIGTELAISQRTNNRDYLNLFPSFHMSYELTEENTFQLSYSRRINRPWFRLLLPFSNYSDSRNFWSGNPDLDPEYTDAFEIGYLRFFDKGSILSSAYYRYRTGVIERITATDSAGFAIRFPVNLAVQNAYGLEFNLNYDFAPWWRMNANANFYRAVTSGDFEGQSLDADTYTFSSRFNSNWTIADKIDIQAAFNYRAPRITPQGRTKSIYRFDLGASMDIMKDKGTLTLSVRDLFNTRVRRSIIDTEEYYADSEFQWRVRQVILSFNYRLNQKKNRGNRGGRGGMDSDDGF